MAMLRITMREAAGYFAPDGPLAEQLRSAALDGLYSAALRAKHDIVVKEIPNKMPRPIDRGIYRAGWQVERLSTGAAVYNPVPHAAMIEYGVPAANVVISRKAILAIAEWAHRKLGIRAGAEAMRVATAIMHALKRRGIFARGKGLRVMEDYARNTLPAIIRQEVAREVAKVARK